MPLLPETKAMLLELAGDRGPDDPVFLSRNHNRLHKTQAYNIIKSIIDRAGVLKGKPTDYRIATHTLRKTFSTLAFHAGCDGRVVERLLRHARRGATDVYIGMPMNHLRGYLEKFSPVRLVKEWKGLPENRAGESVI